MIELTAACVLVASAIALQRSDLGLALTVAMAMLEGPLRKLTPDQPVYFVLLPAVVFAATLLGAAARGRSIAVGKIIGWPEYLSIPVTAYVVWVMIEALNALLSTGNAIVPLYGMATYLGPLVALGFAYSFASGAGERGVERFLRLYATSAALTLTTVYLEAFGFDWAILGEVGEGVLITSVQGNFNALSGLFRASEIAAWHGAAATALLIVLAMRRGLPLDKALWLGIAILVLLGAGVLTGRRKMLVVLLIFACFYVALLAYFRMNASRFASVLAGVGGIVFLASVSFVDMSESNDKTIEYELHLARQRASFAEIPERFVDLGVSPIIWALDRVGPLGSGVGTAGQGARFIGANWTVVAGASEGGLGKIVVELGLPGLALCFWVLFAFLRLVYDGLRTTLHLAPRLATLNIGLAALLGSLGASYTIATQAFSDPFVLIMVGLLPGFLLAIPEFAYRQNDAERAATPSSPPAGPLAVQNQSGT